MIPKVDVVQALTALLPPKKAEVEPRPAIVDEVPFEEADAAHVRGRAFPPGADFFEHGFGPQFGDDDDDDDEGAWEDDDDEEGTPECRTQ
jgi:DnaJ homolog subfamily A member 2